jgi:hypothetical protein
MTLACRASARAYQKMNKERDLTCVYAALDDLVVAHVLLTAHQLDVALGFGQRRLDFARQPLISEGKQKNKDVVRVGIGFLKAYHITIESYMYLQ